VNLDSIYSLFDFRPCKSHTATVTPIATDAIIIENENSGITCIPMITVSLFIRIQLYRIRSLYVMEGMITITNGSDVWTIVRILYSILDNKT